MSTKRGVDKGSVAKYRLEAVQPVSDVHFSQERLIRAISMLCATVVDHNHFGAESQIVGNSIIVGINTFNIVVS